eukprot:Skav202553  [mRNA]  locus=scaffold2011:399227:402437:- [translate_table: standard]
MPKRVGLMHWRGELTRAAAAATLAALALHTNGQQCRIAPQASAGYVWDTLPNAGPEQVVGATNRVPQVPLSTSNLCSAGHLPSYAFAFAGIEGTEWKAAPKAAPRQLQGSFFPSTETAPVSATEPPTDLAGSSMVIAPLPPISEPAAPTTGAPAPPAPVAPAPAATPAPPAATPAPPAATAAPKAKPSPLDAFPDMSMSVQDVKGDVPALTGDFPAAPTSPPGDNKVPEVPSTAAALTAKAARGVGEPIKAFRERDEKRREEKRRGGEEKRGKEKREKNNRKIE